MDRMGGFEPLGGSSILSGPAKRRNKMKTVYLKNKLNGEKFVCENMKNIESIEGVDYLLVHRHGQNRNFLMRLDILEKDNSIKMQKEKSTR